MKQKAKRPEFLPKRLEGEVQTGILEYLRIRGDMLFWRQNRGVLRGASGKPITFGPPGCSDILCCQAPTGRFVAIEVKKPGKKPEPDQEEFLAQVNACGGLGFWADNLQTVIDTLGPPKARVNLNALKRSKRKYPTE